MADTTPTVDLEDEALNAALTGYEPRKIQRALALIAAAKVRPIEPPSSTALG